MKNGQIIKTIKDLRFYLVATLSCLCFSIGFIGYNFPLPMYISELSTPFLVLSLTISVIIILLNFSNVYSLYDKNRTTFLLILFLVVILVVFAKMHWIIIPVVLTLAFYPDDHKLISKYLFFWSLFIFFIIVFLGLVFPELSREPVGKIDSFFGDVTGLKALCLGFANPNQPLFYLFVIAINGSFVFARSRFRRIYTIVMIIFSTIIYLLTLSRTSYLAIIIFLMLYLINSQKIYKILRKSMFIIIIIFTTVSFFIATNYGVSGNQVNTTMTNRPYYWNLRVEDGIIYNMYGNKDRYENSNGPESALDNNYINLIARYGWIIFMIVFYLLVYNSKKADKTDDEVYMLGLFAILIYFISESMPFTTVLCAIPTISIQRKFLPGNVNYERL